MTTILRAAFLSLLIELHNDHLELEQRRINVLRFGDNLLIIRARFVHALGTSQIDQMELGDCAIVGAHLLRVNLDDEDAMGAG